MYIYQRIISIGKIIKSFVQRVIASITRLFEKKLQDEDFVGWLKKKGCSDEVINGILKFNDEDLSVFKERVVKQPDLLTALVENGYDCEAINTVLCFRYHLFYSHDSFLKYKSFIIKLLQNQCPANYLTFFYHNYSHGIYNSVPKYQEVYLTFFKYFPRSLDAELFDHAARTLLFCSQPK